MLSPQSPGSCGQQRQERTQEVDATAGRSTSNSLTSGGRQTRSGSNPPTRRLRALQALGRKAVGHEDGPHPPNELGAVAVTSEQSSFSSAVPPTCHKQRSSAVHSGWSRSLGEGGLAGRTPLTWGGGGGRNRMACKRSALQHPGARSRQLPKLTYGCFRPLDQLRVRRTTDSNSGEADVGYGLLGRLEGGLLVTRARGPPASDPEHGPTSSLAGAGNRLAVLAGLGTAGGAAGARGRRLRPPPSPPRRRPRPRDRVHSANSGEETRVRTCFVA
jgi:hypothetical protein